MDRTTPGAFRPRSPLPRSRTSSGRPGGPRAPRTTSPDLLARTWSGSRRASEPGPNRTPSRRERAVTGSDLNRVRAGLYREWEHDRPLASTAVLRIESGPGAAAPAPRGGPCRSGTAGQVGRGWSDIIDLHHRRPAAFVTSPCAAYAPAGPRRRRASPPRPARRRIPPPRRDSDPPPRRHRLDSPPQTAPQTATSSSPAKPTGRVGNFRGYTPNERPPGTPRQDPSGRNGASSRPMSGSRGCPTTPRSPRAPTQPVCCARPAPTGPASGKGQSQPPAQRARTADADRISRRHHHDYTAAARVDHGPSIGGSDPETLRAASVDFRHATGERPKESVAVPAPPDRLPPVTARSQPTASAQETKRSWTEVSSSGQKKCLLLVEAPNPEGP